MEGVNIMHSKLQLLSHPSHLRIVIPSANLVPYDWGEQGGIMENVSTPYSLFIKFNIEIMTEIMIQTVFLIDLPRLPHGRETLHKDLTFFGKELMRFLKAMGLSEKTSNSILKFDFTETCKIAFIHSMLVVFLQRYWAWSVPNKPLADKYHNTAEAPMQARTAQLPAMLALAQLSDN